MKLKYYYRAWLDERDRIFAWRKRHNPKTNKRYSWFEAFRATVENPRKFDNFWDDEMENKFHQSLIYEKTRKNNK